MPLDGVTKRSCEDCDQVIEHRHKNAVLCESCALRRLHMRRSADKQKRSVRWEGRRCEVCETDISQLRWCLRTCSEHCNAEYRREYIRMWREKHPESDSDYYVRNVTAHSERVREYRTARRGVVNRWARDARDRLIKLKATRPMPTKCEGCGDVHEFLQFDHDHTTGEFRGWLCGRCNRALGHAKDSIERLANLIAYLEESRRGKQNE
jgi:hypothetical protein